MDCPSEENLIRLKLEGVEGIINTGVILAGVLVLLTQSKYPDLIIGAIVFLVVVKGAIRILKLGK